MAGQFVEIRDYTIEPQWWDAYKKWLIDDGAPCLKRKFDIIDFWISGDLEAEVSGSDPKPSPTASLRCAGLSAGRTRLREMRGLRR